MSSIDPPVVGAIPVAAGTNWLSAARDYLALTKPRLTLLAVLAAWAGYIMAVEGPIEKSTLVGLLVGSVLIGGGANALNQVMERDRDALMSRTANRPLPSGRLGLIEARGFGQVLAVSGVCYTAVYVGWASAGIGLVTLLTYLLIYTPLKPRTSWNTVVGAVPGALPVVIGWCAAGRGLSLEACSLFVLLFVWQLPHFWAICWCHADDYRSAGFRMVPLQDSSGRATGTQSAALCVVLLAISFVPAWMGMTGRIYSAVAAAAGAGLLVCAVLFAWRGTRAAAYTLFTASILHLPVLMTVMVLDKR